jgi:hypothetical protein
MTQVKAKWPTEKKNETGQTGCRQGDDCTVPEDDTTKLALDMQLEIFFCIESWSDEGRIRCTKRKDM